MVLTDPPYNVNYGEKNEFLNRHAKGRRLESDIENDVLPEDEFANFLFAAFRNLSNALKPGGAFYIWYMDNMRLIFQRATQENSLVIKENLIWVKNQFVLGRQDYQHKHEPCLYGWKEGEGHYFIEDRSQSDIFEKPEDLDELTEAELRRRLIRIYDIPSTVIREDKPRKADLHPTMKPLPLIARLIRNSSKAGETVLDLFGGSGTTLIACEKLKRRCLMMEFDPKYCDVIIKRWEETTGKKAVKLN